MGDERFYGQIPVADGTGDAPGGSDKHGSRGPLSRVRIGDLVAGLEEYRGGCESAELGPVFVGAPTRHQGHRDSGRVLALPTGDLGHEGRTGVAVG